MAEGVAAEGGLVLQVNHVGAQQHRGDRSRLVREPDRVHVIYEIPERAEHGADGFFAFRLGAGGEGPGEGELANGEGAGAVSGPPVTAFPAAVSGRSRHSHFTGTKIRVKIGMLIAGVTQW